MENNTTQTTQTSSTALPDLARQGSREYSESHYKFLSTLIESESARSLYIQIGITDLSGQAVNAFHKFITAHFDKSVILANYSQQEKNRRLIEYKIDANLMVSECLGSDIQNPTFMMYQRALENTFTDFLSRSGKERDQLLKQEYGMTTSESKPQQQQQQGGFFGGRRQ